MKKKVFVALAVAMAVLPCFAEIRVKRYSASEGLTTINTATYWNDKYNSDFSPPDVTKTMLKNLLQDGLSHFNSTIHYYFGYDGSYTISLFYNFIGTTRIDAFYNTYDDDYEEILFSEEYVSYNSAKAKFDSLCQQYYNKIK